MHRSIYLTLCLFSLASTAQVFAEVTTDVENLENEPEKTPLRTKISNKAQQLQTQLKVDARAAQAEEVKDPFQPLNRKIYQFNDVIDRNVLRPVAVQYVEKVPKDVRGSYTQFRNNLGEPWNVVNQLIQGRPARAAKSLSRFTINTLTTLGLADPARRLGLSHEDERLGITLGYYGVPSGPYIMLPLLGPSSVRGVIGSVVDSQARPQKYILDDNDGLYWSDQSLRVIDTRSEILDVEGVLTGDRYAQIRDIYLQRTSYAIAEKKGLESESLFTDIDDEFEDEFDEDQSDSTQPTF
ncbi:MULTISPECIES: MlaA family lipoprotein [Acinetobacter]|jgi:phospholipid-binding lipoprotein MlaA|uniref:MlaA family lipoprotein n=1 Tax=Acinetobacter TaxID=469 RepID=UPI00066276E9|nr:MULTISPECIES: VacJ family lipoprotein [Acinetobacter]KMV00365.1 VacJ family lipoprotein [Acinetobacter sp. VT 511]MBB4836918.1 phospholipid-binding lipoprotein MlaA [Acinetobacter schindleri]MCU4324529.1 VacJ family lipoprotein [Acinetobacter schindleri]MDP1446196.1 VacJ family lipoprotein [Acinetobacter schindleri]PUR00881.1 VacJ family lipoprotein [Acinetobacter schindleri]